MLQSELSMERGHRVARGTFRRNIVPALGGAWCVAYLMEIVRCTATMYGYGGTP
jgi:hypothetical protein